MNYSPKFLLMAAIFLLLLAACGGQDPEPTAPPTPIVDAAPTETAVPPSPTPLAEDVVGLATVESVQLLIMESFPVQVNVQARGVLPNNCAVIDNIISQQNGNAFDIAITTLQEAGQVCAEVIVPFEEVVPLAVEGLPAGSYTVSVNGVSGSFSLAMDNVAAPADEIDTPAPTSADMARMNGRLWHDLCAPPLASLEEGAEPPAGCLALPDGGLAANGLLEADEPGIAGVRVSLGEGECPAVGLGVAVTAEDGSYAFAELAPGVYCVSINPLDDINQEILLPGRWTFPAADVGETTVELAAGDESSDVNFGWDFQFLPLPDVNAADCTNSIEFVADLNIPDDTAFTPGAEFTKRWQLRNNGTCIWTTDYNVAFVGGDQMSAPDNIPFAQPVVPGQTVDVSVEMVAPATPGTYRGNWQISDANGDLFGIDGFIGDAFWLQIVVAADAQPLSTPEPNSAVLGGIVWDDFCINSNPGRGCWEFPENSGNFIADGTQAANEPSLPGITISLAGGVCPSDGTLPPASQIIERTVTGEDGRFSFTGLSAATYCVFMDALSTANVDLLIPGNWTWPATGVGQYTVALSEGEQRLDLDFGWDFVD